MTVATGDIQWEKLIVSDISMYPYFTDVTVGYEDNTHDVWVLSHWHKTGSWSASQRKYEYYITWWPVPPDVQDALVMWVQMKGVLK